MIRSGRLLVAPVLRFVSSKTAHRPLPKRRNRFHRWSALERVEVFEERILLSATTVTTVTASAGSETYGQTETFTAHVSSQAGIPNAGTVTFLDGTTALGSAPVNEGTAVLQPVTLSLGLHVVTASYSGDGVNFSRSSSVLGPSSVIQTVAGTGNEGDTGDGGPATSAELDNPYGIAVDAAGDLFIADALNNSIREVNAATHVITTVAGTGTAGYNGDGIAATSADLNQPIAVAVDAHGNLFISDTGNERIREVNAATGLISTVAGTGNRGDNGNGIPATSAELNLPFGVAVDSAGDLFIADYGNELVREVNASTGLISIVAGTGNPGYNGDGILATSAELSSPTGVALDSAGDLFIADAANNLVREVSASTHLISSVAGTGTAGYNGDGIAATSAELNSPEGVAVDAAGDLFIVDHFNQRLREVSAVTGLISTIAGTGTAGYNGDGIPANTAELSYPSPTGVAVDAAGNVFVSEFDTDRVREIASGALIIPVTPATPSVVAADASGLYSGNPFSASATATGVDGVTPVSGSIAFTYYEGSSASGTGTPSAPIVPGTYTVVASFTSSDPDYANAPSAPVTFTISPGSLLVPTVTALDAGGTYDGQSFPPNITVTGADGVAVSGSNTVTYYNGSVASGSGSLTAPTNAGTYTAVAFFTSADANYTDGQSAPVTFTIGQATPVVVANEASAEFTGYPIAATGTAIGVDGTTPVSGSFAFTYYVGSSASGMGTSAAPINLGTYTVVASFTSADANYTGGQSAPVTFTISKLMPNLAISDAGGAFDGHSFPASVSVLGSTNLPVPLPLATNYSTFLGGSVADAGLAITIDSLGNTFVTGYTISPDFPVTPGAYETTFQPDNPNDVSGFVAKFDPSGNLLWSTYINAAEGLSIAVDSQDNVYVAGLAASTGFATTPGAFQPTANSELSAFVLKLNPSGSTAVWSTYLGGSNFSEVDGLAIDGSGNVYLAGDTADTDFPTLNPIQSQYASTSFGENAFISEFNSTGSALIFSTYLGGNNNDVPSAIALDAAGNIYVDGTTSSTNLPTTPNAFQPTYPGGGSDAFVAKLSAGGTSLAYLTYLGGNVADTSSNVGMAVDAAGDAYVTGTTLSPDFPTVNAYQSTLSGSEDAYVAELNPSGTALVNSTYFGGSSTTTGSAIALDSAGNVYIAGQTSSTDLPLVNPVNDTGDYYVAELNLSQAALLNSTYFGSSQDQGFSNPIAVNELGQVVVTGQTSSSAFPTSANAFQPNYGGGNSNAFLTDFTPAGLTLAYYAGTTASGTPLAGAPTDAGTYTVVATLQGGVEYAAASNSLTFTISGALPVIAVSDGGGVYDGNQFPANATATGLDGAEVNGTLSYTYYDGSSTSGAGTSTAPTDAGAYTVVVDFVSADPDYVNAESAPLTFTINQATPTVDVVDLGGPYTGNPYNATATATGVSGGTVNGTFAFTYYVGATVNGTGSSTAPTNPGTYTVTAAFASADPDYTNASGGPVTFVISQTGPAIMVPTAAVLYENGSLTFSTATDDQITLTDGTAVGTSDSLTLSATHGLLKFGSTTGLKFTSGSNHSSSMTVNGTLANLNAALQTLKYTPTSGYIGPDSLSLTVSNSINHQSASVSVALTIYGPPTLSAPATAGVNENGALVFSPANGNPILLSDAAASATSDTLVLTATHGTLFLGSTAGLTFTAGANGSASMTINGTLADLSAALNGLEYTPKVGYSGAASLTIKAKDATSGFTTTATTAITVSIPASQPTVAVTTEFPTAVPGQPVPLVITVTDTNSTAQAADFKLVISFGDGKSATISAAPDSLIVNHVYTKTGTYTVSITATDEYGHTSSAGTTTITVVPVAVEIDPFDLSQTALFVGGTGGKDTVALTASGNQIAVTLNKVAEETFSTTGPLIVFGQGGADTVTVGAGVTNTSYLLETPNADNAETDMDNETIQWAGLSSAVEILNE
jgi:Bacterial Ig-like domain (group 3)/PKD domain/Beta-propeller repeat